MAYFGFTNKLLKGEKIQIFNYGNCKRDFTYIDDMTYADTSALERDFGFKPSTSLGDGLRKFAEWYKEFYKV